MTNKRTSRASEPVWRKAHSSRTAVAWFLLNARYLEQHVPVGACVVDFPLQPNIVRLAKLQREFHSAQPTAGLPKLHQHVTGKRCVNLFASSQVWVKLSLWRIWWSPDANRFALKLQIKRQHNSLFAEEILHVVVDWRKLFVHTHTHARCSGIAGYFVSSHVEALNVRAQSTFLLLEIPRPSI